MFAVEQQLRAAIKFLDGVKCLAAKTNSVRIAVSPQGFRRNKRKDGRSICVLVFSKLLSTVASPGMILEGPMQGKV